MFYNIIVAVIAVICALLILVVLLQNGQGSGLSGIAASGMAGGNAGLGARRTADLLSKATSILGGSFLVLCVLANFAIDRQEVDRSILQDGGAGVNAPVEAPSQTQSAVPLQQDNNASGTTAPESGGSESDSEN